MFERGPFSSADNNQFLLEATHNFPENRAVMRYYSRRLRSYLQEFKEDYFKIPKKQRLIYTGLYFGSIGFAGYGLGSLLNYWVYR